MEDQDVLREILKRLDMLVDVLSKSQPQGQAPAAASIRAASRVGTTRAVKASPPLRFKGKVSATSSTADGSSGVTPHSGDEFGAGKPGELIVCYATADEAARSVVDDVREEKIDEVKHVESMADRMKGAEIVPQPLKERQLHLVSVPPGQESAKANHLHYLYTRALANRLQKELISLEFAAALGRADLGFIVQPNHYMSLAAAPAPVQATSISAANFRFTEFHSQNRYILNVPTERQQGTVKIAVIDSGIAADFQPTLPQQNTANPRGGAIDEVGHGTTICKIIHDIAPFASLSMYKVINQGRILEWNVTAALNDAVVAGNHIANVSLEFGLSGVMWVAQADPTVTFPASQQVMSSNFEGAVRGAVASGCIVVAAAGNHSECELAYPARFKEAVAVSAVNSLRQRSSFSNYGDKEVRGGRHPNRFAFPGGETPHPGEPICHFGDDYTHSSGTSQAAAYATGFIAHLWEQTEPADRNPVTVLSALRRAAVPGTEFPPFNGYNVAEHGFGIPRL